MLANSSIVVNALVPAVGIAGLNDNEWPQANGLGTRIIGTSAGKESTLYLDPASLVAHERRLAKELAALVSGGAIRVTIDGVAQSSAQLLNISSVASVEEVVSIPVDVHGNWDAISGTWTEAYNDTTHLWSVALTAAASTREAVLDLPIPFLRGIANAGFKPTGLTLVYEIATEIANDVTVALFKVATPANGVAPAAVALSTGQTYDTGHDTAAERGAIDDHTMVITLDPALAAVDWLNSNETLVAELTVNDTTGGLADFTLKGWVLHGLVRTSAPAVG